MNKRIIRELAWPILLAGCAGSGGSATSTIQPVPVPVPTLTTLPAGVSVSNAVDNKGIPKSETSVIDPDFTLATVGDVGRFDSTGNVTKVTIRGINAATDDTILTITNDAEIDEAIVNVPNGADAYSEASSIEIMHSKTIALGTLSASPTSPDDISGSAAKPFQASYLTWGSWINTSSAMPPSVSVGVFVFGDATQPNNIPASGTATYNGFAWGLANDLDYEDYGGAEAEWHTHANMQAEADFGLRTLAFTTTGTVVPVTNPTTGVTVVVAAPQLDMTGTLAYSAPENLFSGTVTDAGSRSGTATGRFYGPAAEEIGGVYVLGDNNNGHNGYFAGKK